MLFSLYVVPIHISLCAFKSVHSHPHPIVSVSDDAEGAAAPHRGGARDLAELSAVDDGHGGVLPGRAGGRARHLPAHAQGHLQPPPPRGEPRRRGKQNHSIPMQFT